MQISCKLQPEAGGVPDSEFLILLFLQKEHMILFFEIKHMILLTSKASPPSVQDKQSLT
jgi:hypothetical protein